MYMLSKKSGVPHTTVLDICSGKAKINKCNSETVYKLAVTLNVKMEELVIESMEKRPNFENYKSSICHRVKRYGDLNFIEEVLLSGEIDKLFAKEWYPESLYLLAMLDYLCRINDIPQVKEYNELRKTRLNELLYPAGIHMLYMFSGNENYKEMSVNESIPEFLRHNIVESEIRNVF